MRKQQLQQEARTAATEILDTSPDPDGVIAELAISTRLADRLLVAAYHLIKAERKVDAAARDVQAAGADVVKAIREEGKGGI